MPSQLRVELDDSFDRDDILQIRSLLAHDKNITIRSEKRTLGLLSEITAVLPIAAFAVSVANLTLSILKYNADRGTPQRIDFEWLEKHLSTELAKLGLLNWRLKSIENFSALTDGRAEPCMMVIETDSGAPVRLSARLERSTLRLHLD